MSKDGTGWWQPPVTVKTARPGKLHVVSSAAAGLDQLREWNRRQSPLWRKAFELCVAAMDGKVSPDEARAAFLAAAKATKNLVKE